MKLVIDSEFALGSNVGQAFRRPEAGPNGVVIAVNLPAQDYSNWCWAAIGCAVGNYYNGTDLTQPDIALRVHGSTSQDSNVDTRLDDALRAVDCFSHWSPGRPSLDRIRFEINLGRPIGVRIAWYDGSAHYVLLHGYDPKSDRIIIADPSFGNCIIPLSDFPTKYQQCGSLTESFWTKSLSQNEHPERISNGRI
jgi:hypothetical protein